MTEQNIQKILSVVDHTNLKVDATWEDIKAICDDGIKYQTASVCIPPSYVKRAKEYVGEELKICTVIGFPNGYNTTPAKVFETTDAVKNGADEIDMVINIGKVKDGDYEYVQREIEMVKMAAEDKLLKVIVETCLLTDEEKRQVLQGARQTEHYKNIESITFNDFIKGVMSYGTEQK